MNLALLKYDLQQAEDVRSVAYDDQTGEPIGPGSLVQGHPTIGVGKRLDLPLSPAAIEFLLEESITDTCDALDRAIPWWRELDEIRQRTLCEMGFQLGVTGLIRFTRALAAVKSGDYEKAASELLDSRWSKQVGRRAERLAAQMREPVQV